MATSLYDMKKALALLTGKITGENTLELTGPQKSIDLFVLDFQTTTKIYQENRWEANDDNFPAFDLKLERVCDQTVKLTGNWQILNNVFTGHGISITQTQPCSKFTEKLFQ